MDSEGHPEVEYYPAESTRTVPFSAAVREGKMLYLSGQIGMNETGTIVSGGIAEFVKPSKEIA